MSLLFCGNSLEATAGILEKSYVSPTFCNAAVFSSHSEQKDWELHTAATVHLANNQTYSKHQALKGKQTEKVQISRHSAKSQRSQ